MQQRTLLLVLAITAASSASAQGPADGPEQAAVAGLMAQGIKVDELGGLRIADSYVDTRTGIRHSWMRQQWQGIDIFGSEVALHQRPDGEVVALTHRLVEQVESQAGSATPGIAPADALRNVLERDGSRIVLPAITHNDPGKHRWYFQGEAFSNEEPFVELIWMRAGEALWLAWNVNYYLPDGSHWWSVRIDAATGKEIERNDWVVSCGPDHCITPVRNEADECSPIPAPLPASPNDFRIYRLPIESPNHGARTLHNAPWTAAPIASPYAWFDTNGAPGAEYTITRGNNVYASEDVNADDVPGFSPNSATLDFDFPLNLANAPNTYQSASLSNLFYVCNIMHDVLYHYGFDEVSGNFQSNNYGRGGMEGDFIYADDQDGLSVNNGNFAIVPDGTPGRMQAFNWNFASPVRAGSLDNGLITHEYGHGLSSRLVGGPSNAYSLSNNETASEGWSDYIALMMTMEPGDLGTDARGLNTYLLNQPITGAGIRPFPYTTNVALNNLTYASTNNSTLLPGSHGLGTMWCTVLWDMTWALINQYGFSPDLYNGTSGNNIALQLVIDGMKYTPSHPGFVDARDAILLADQIDNGGANQNLIWTAFAARGLGFSASEGSVYSRGDQVAAFDMPGNNNVGVRSAAAPLPGAFFDCNNGLPVSLNVRNNGLVAQGNFNVSYRVDGGAVITQLFAGNLAVGATMPVSFPAPLTLGAYGVHTLKAWTSLPTDQFHGDDTLNFTFTWQATAQLPFGANAEDGLALPTGWSVQNPDGIYTWGNVVLAVGANCASTRAFRMNYYTYFSQVEEDRLVTPLIDLAGSAGTHLQFHHAYAPFGSGRDDGLRVEISINCGSSWTVLYSAFGAALGTAPQQSASAYVPTACNQWLLHDIDLSAYDGQNVMLRFTGICNFGNDLFLDNITLVNNGVKLALKVMLEGPYDSGTLKMRDDLRTAGLIPNAEPYTALGFTQASDGGGEVRQALATAASGDNAVVDWVLVELRNANTPQTIVATRAALLQRDGDVVAEDGINPIALLATPGNYKVAVRHRNHLGAMASGTVALSTSTTSIDLSLPATATYGTEGQKAIGTRTVLWAGNALRDPALRYTGANNDRDPILVRIGGAVPTATANGYFVEDVTLDGQVKYVGASNDRDPILVNIGGAVPTNTRAEQLP